MASWLRWAKDARLASMSFEAGLFLSEQLIQFRKRLAHLCGVGRRVGAFPRLEVVAEIGPRLVADLVSGRLSAMFRDARVVIDTQLADVQLRAALRAFIQPPQRQA
jgi:hypothetical protein